MTTYVIVTGYTGAGKPKYLTATKDWTDSLASAMRITDRDEAQQLLLSVALSGGDVFKIEKVVSI